MSKPQPPDNHEFKELLELLNAVGRFPEKEEPSKQALSSTAETRSRKVERENRYAATIVSMMPKRTINRTLAVPELTRSADIKLNERVSLRRHADPLSSLE
jgi:hypothetical protein